MTGPAYKPRSDFIPKLSVSPQIRKALAEVAEKAKGIAEGLSQDFKDTGEYADSFEVTEETIEFNGRGPRAASRLYNRAGHAAAVEWGYEGRSGAETSSAHRVLGRTADALKDRA